MCVNTQGLFPSLQVHASDIPTISPPFNSREKWNIRELPFHPFRADRRTGWGVRTLGRTLSWDFLSPSASPTEQGNIQDNQTRLWKGSVPLDTESISTSLTNCLPYLTVSVFMILYYCLPSVIEHIVYVVFQFWSMYVVGILQQTVMHNTAHVVVHARMCVFRKVGSGSASVECIERWQS